LFFESSAEKNEQRGKNQKGCEKQSAKGHLAADISTVEGKQSLAAMGLGMKLDKDRSSEGRPEQ
jgi:hypothetical protein